MTLPALARAQKVMARLERTGSLDAAVRAAAVDDLSATLLAAVLRAHRDGLDAEAALRAAVARLAGSGG